MTKKQAEQRAFGLYPNDDNDIIREAKRKAYMQCWEDLKGAPKLKYMRTPSKNQNADHSL